MCAVCNLIMWCNNNPDYSCIVVINRKPDTDNLYSKIYSILNQLLKKNDIWIVILSALIFFSFYFDMFKKFVELVPLWARFQSSWQCTGASWSQTHWLEASGFKLPHLCRFKLQLVIDDVSNRSISIILINEKYVTALD